MTRASSVAGLALLLPLAACGGGIDDPAANPTNISIAPSAPASSTPPSSTAASSTAATSVPATDPSTARSEGVQDVATAVAAAESAVADSAAVEASRDDDETAWTVTVRAGENGRELQISATDGTVLSNRADQLDPAQLGELPGVTAQRAITTAEKRVADGVVTELELTQEDGRRLWDVSAEVGGGDEWELWIDASSGDVVREERG